MRRILLYFLLAWVILLLTFVTVITANWVAHMERKMNTPTTIRHVHVPIREYQKGLLENEFLDWVDIEATVD